MRTFVVGDVHGWAPNLAALLREIRRDAEARDSLVFIGDYVDRGPDARDVVEQLLTEREQWPGPVVTLKGNHEAMMMEALATWRDTTLPEWEWIEGAGGRATVLSYARDCSMQAFEDALPAEHRAFFESLSTWHEDENGIYVHAGIPPGRGIESCGEEDLLWIRDPFIRSTYRWHKPVVFGHTPQFDHGSGSPESLDAIRWCPLNRPEKIGIDTGCAYGGPLTAVVLPERRFYRASRRGD